MIDIDEPINFWTRLIITNAKIAMASPIIAYISVEVAEPSFFESPEEVTILKPEMIIKTKESMPTMVVNNLTIKVARAPTFGKMPAGPKLSAILKELAA